MKQIAQDVFLFTGTAVNWVLVREGRDLTLIDGGWPGDLAAVRASIEAIGHRPEDIRAVLLTHAHVDHVGALDWLHQQYGTPLYTSAAEAAHARGEVDKEQAHIDDIVPLLWRPRVLRWTADILRAGVMTHVVFPHAQPVPADGQPLDLPGRPVPVLTAGHTSGHTAFYLPGRGLVATGDALVTAHPTSPTYGPQLLPGYFSHDPCRAADALGVFDDLDADIVAPGHGPVWTGPMTTATTHARRQLLAS